MPANPNTYDATAAGWGATAGLRNAAFVDEFGANGLKLSICESDFLASMKVIGDTVVKKLQNLCVDYQLVDTDLVTPGLQPDCRVVYRTPVIDPRDPSRVTYDETPMSLPMCKPADTSATIDTDCWQLTYDKDRCPFSGQLINVLRTAYEIKAGPLTPGTKIGMQCRTCPALSSSAVPIPGC